MRKFMAAILLISLVCTVFIVSGITASEGSNLIVYTQKTLDQYFHVALQDKVEEAVINAGYEVEVTNCNNDSTLQNHQIQNFIVKRPKGIIANAVDSDAINDVVERATSAGIPVVFVDNPCSTAVVDCTVTYDNYGAGYMACELIIDKLVKKYGEVKGTVVNVYGAMHSECWRLRKEGFDACMAQYPGIKYIQVPGQGEHAESMDALTNIIAQYRGEIDAVHCPSDAPGLGCAEALKVANMWHPVGHKDHIIFVTCDGEPDAVQGLIDGYYDAIVVEDSYAYGQIPVDILTTYIFKGQKVPTSGTYTNENFYWKTAEFSSSPRGPELKVPPYVLDASNVDDDSHWGVMALKAGAK